MKGFNLFLVNYKQNLQEELKEIEKVSIYF